MEAEEKRQREKLLKYEISLKFLLQEAMTAEKGEVSLAQIKAGMEERNVDVSTLIPNVQIFKEIMVELLKSREIDIGRLKEE